MIESLSFRDLVPAVAILGSALAAVLTLIFTRRWQARKRLTLWIEKTEDLSRAFGKHDDFAIVFKQGEQEIQNLNRAIVGVENTGTVNISDLSLEVEIPETHKARFARKDSIDKSLQEAVLLQWKESPNTQARLQISLRFFNPGETFRIILFFDGPSDDCKVYCRIEGVEVNHIPLSAGR